MARGRGVSGEVIAIGSPWVPLFQLLGVVVSLSEAKPSKVVALPLPVEGSRNGSLPWQGRAMASSLVRRKNADVPNLRWLSFATQALT